MTTASLDDFIKNLKLQIAEGDLALALDQLQNFLSASAPDLQDEVILLTARYNRLRREERKGVLDPATAQARLNKLTNDLLEFLDEVKRKISRDMAPVKSPASGPLVMPQEVGLEKIIGVNNLKQIAWVEQSLQVSRSVCRILTPEGLGSGFLIAPDLLMTNHHVIGATQTAAQSVAEFNYQHDLAGNLLPSYRYRLDVNRFYTNPHLDYTIVGLLADLAKPDLATWGHLRLDPSAEPVAGEHVTIIQHPNGGFKQIALTANQVVGLWEHRLHYTTDTMPGSSGAPVFNDLWQVIAIHHAGGDLQVNAQGARRFINEGILMSAIRPDAGVYWPG